MLGLSSPNDDDKILSECPTLKCLGAASCWGNLADPCYSDCETRWVEFEGTREENCGADVCNVGFPPCEGDDVCTYCPPDGSLPCQVNKSLSFFIFFFLSFLSFFLFFFLFFLSFGKLIGLPLFYEVMEGISSQEDCEELVACQLFDGEIILGITEDECRAQQVTKLQNACFLKK